MGHKIMHLSFVLLLCGSQDHLIVSIMGHNSHDKKKGFMYLNFVSFTKT